MDITPEPTGWLGGYPDRSRPATGVTTRLRLKALALLDPGGTPAVLVSADVLGLPPGLDRAIREAVCRQFGFEPSQVMLVASHTHGGPALPERPSPEIYLGLDEPALRWTSGYAEDLRDRAVEAVGRALHSMRRARLSFGRGRATFGVNRRLRGADGRIRLAENPGGPTDPDVPVLWVEGHTRAVVFTYACHPTTLGLRIRTYHADYPGWAAEVLERQLSGGPALFAAGCGGDVNPFPRGTFRWAARHGRALAEAAAATHPSRDPCTRPLGGPLRTTLRVVHLPLRPLPDRVALEPLLHSGPSLRQRHAREMLRLFHAGALPTTVPVSLQAWRFGSDLLVVALGGEPCIDYAIRLKRELTGDCPTWVLGYANGVPCYLPSERVLAEGGYEAGWDPSSGPDIPAGSMLVYGWPAALATGVEDRVISAIRGLASAP